MEMSMVQNMSKTEMMSCITAKKNEIADKLQRGETQESFVIGGNSFTNSEWDKLIGKVDEQIDEIKEEQEARKDKAEEQQQAYEAALSRANPMYQKLNGGYQQSCPYEYLAKDGVIEYNGVVFACDTKHNAISLGDVSDKSKVITVRLSGGGTLYVNRENIGDLSQAMGMFSPEDVNCILRALADDAKVQKTEEEIEEAGMHVGEETQE